jgi:hypothetical protein
MAVATEEQVRDHTELGVQLKLGRFSVTKVATGWLLEVNGDEMRQRGIERAAYWHAFTTWADMMTWILAQARESD